MIPADEALRIVLDNVASLGVERVANLDALGRVLACEIRAPRDIPGFDNSAMDGYALRAADVTAATQVKPVRLHVTETVPAGRMPSRRVESGQAARTMTGAPIAAGADAVIPVERTRSEDDWVEVMAPVAAGEFIRPRGEDLREGEAVMGAGRVLGPSDLGMLASLNRGMIEVFRKPRVAIVATGDELVDIDQVPTGAQVINSSAFALSAAIREAGGEATILRVARDSPAEVRERLKEALGFDVILSTGGVSVGQFDHVKVVMDELGMSTLFHGVAQKPGRPLKFGILAERPVFGLPGNPVSTLVCFYLYVRPAVLKMLGRADVGLRRIQVRCGCDIKVANNLTEFIRVRLERKDGATVARPTGFQGSGVMSSLSRANGLLVGPSAVNQLREGDQATVLLLAELGDEAFFEEERRFHKN